jgi:PKD repeat protein
MTEMPKTAKVGIIFGAIGIAVGVGIALLIVNNQNREMTLQQPESDVNKPEVASPFGFYNAKYPTALAVGEKGAFVGSSDGGKPPYTFEWKFSDGVTLTGQNVTRSFVSPGAYHFNLIVTDAIGRQVKSADLNIRILQEVPEGQGTAANATSTQRN